MSVRNKRRKQEKKLKPEDAAGSSVPEKWYFKKKTFVVAFLIVGPFALPLLWINPRYSLRTKIVWTLGIAVLTWIFGFVTKELYEVLMKQLGF